MAITWVLRLRLLGLVWLVVLRVRLALLSCLKLALLKKLDWWTEALGVARLMTVLSCVCDIRPPVAVK